jgi:uncharacterized protein YkwD
MPVTIIIRKPENKHMTLVAPSRKRPPAYHKKVSGGHHKRSKAYHKTYWPYLPMLLIVLAGTLLNGVLPATHSVLGYATDMSVSSLYVDTNQQREANGEADLNLNSQLNNAAQAKANDMAARDYWSHNTPDGKTPWTFMTAAGYNYQLAGENLAYGFDTAADTITGWMNSPEHRANILNAGYKDVGFGYINIANYQNTGPETLVVAMYGAQAAAPTPTQPSNPQPTATTGDTSSSSGGGSQDTTTTTTTSPTQETQNSAPPTPTQTEVVTPKSVKAAEQAPKAQTVSRVQILTAGKAPWSLLVLSLLGTAALLAFLLRHGLAWHKIFIKGEKFILHHPLLDIALVAIATVAFVLGHSVGVIR